MMSYYYDERGWYTSEQLPGRDTDIEPPMLSETTTTGELRANFTGRAWLTLPYFEPAPPPAFDRAAAALQIDPAKVYPVTVDLDARFAPPGGLPRPGGTMLTFTNNHLGYAITWYGLMLTALGVGFVFLRRRWRGAE